MIYKTTRKPVFDDTIIKGVDSIVDGMYHRKTETYANHLPTIAYLNEFRSVFLALPRQTGKTTYIKKLYAHLQDMGHCPVIITNRKIDADNSYGRNFEVKPIHQITDIGSFLGKQSYYDVLLFDEVHPDKAKQALALLSTYQNRFTTKINFVLGLYT